MAADIFSLSTISAKTFCHSSCLWGRQQDFVNAKGASLPHRSLGSVYETISHVVYVPTENEKGAIQISDNLISLTCSIQSCLRLPGQGTLIVGPQQWFYCRDFLDLKSFHFGRRLKNAGKLVVGKLREWFIDFVHNYDWDVKNYNIKNSKQYSFWTVFYPRGWKGFCNSRFVKYGQTLEQVVQMSSKIYNSPMQ